MSGSNGDILNLPGGDDPTLGIDDRIKLNVWQMHRANGFAHIGMPRFLDRMAQSLSVLRRYSPRVFTHVARVDMEANAIAMYRGWLVDKSDERRDRTEEELAHASKIVAEAVAGMQTKATMRSGMTIDDAREQAARAFEAQHGRAPGDLSREQLSELRKAAGVPDIAPKPAFAEPAEPERGGPPHEPEPEPSPEPPPDNVVPLQRPWWMETAA